MRGASGDAARRDKDRAARPSNAAFEDYIKFEDMFGASSIFTTGTARSEAREREAYVKDVMERKLYRRVRPPPGDPRRAHPARHDRGRVRSPGERRRVRARGGAGGRDRARRRRGATPRATGEGKRGRGRRRARWRRGARRDAAPRRPARDRALGRLPGRDPGPLRRAIPRQRREPRERVRGHAGRLGARLAVGGDGGGCGKPGVQGWGARIVRGRSRELPSPLSAPKPAAPPREALAAHEPAPRERFERIEVRARDARRAAPPPRSNDPPPTLLLSAREPASCST